MEMNGPINGAVRQDRPGTFTARRLAELEAEVAALRRVLAEAGLKAEGAADRHAAGHPHWRAGRQADDVAGAASPVALDAQARHGREMAVNRADLAASERVNDALRRANADLTASRAALRESEARWRGLFERMQEGFALCEVVHGPHGGAVDYRHLELNAAWGRLTGLPAEAVQGRLAGEAIPGIEPFWLETFARVAETGEPAHFEHHLAACGRWFEVHAYRTEPGRFATLFTEVTERKRAEARRDALVELSDRLRDLRDPGEIARTAAEVTGRALAAARAGYGTLDPDGGIVRVEHDWTRGASAASVGGEHRLSGYWTGFADDLRRGEVVAVGDAARGDPRTARHADSFAALGIRAFVHVPVVEEGRVAAILFVHDTAPRDWSAAEVGFVCGVAERAWAAARRARAEAALRDSERRLQATQDHAGVGIHELDREGRYVRVNETFTRMSGYTLDDLAGRSFWDFIEGEEVRCRARDAFARLVRGEIDRLAVERPYTGKYGRRWWAEVTTTAIRDALDAEHPEGRFLYAVRVVHDITERKRAEERRALLVNELNHRVKNTLAVVQSLALQTARGAPDLPSFGAAFQARLLALARAHDVLTREDWTGAPLDAVVRAALEPLAMDKARVDLSGCASGVVLPPGAALALTMALHELATNALKHGALSVPDGRVSVACADADAADAAPVVEWLERGGPPVAGPPARRGFGLRLLQRGLTAQAGMGADLRFVPEGVRCTLRLPPGPAGTKGWAPVHEPPAEYHVQHPRAPGSARLA